MRYYRLKPEESHRYVHFKKGVVYPGNHKQDCTPTVERLVKARPDEWVKVSWFTYVWNKLTGL